MKGLPESKQDVGNPRLVYVEFDGFRIALYMHIPGDSTNSESTCKDENGGESQRRGTVFKL